MRRLAGYLRLQLKRTAKAYIGILALTLVLLCAVGAVGAAVLGERSEDESFAKLSVGVVGDKEDPMLKMGLTLLRETDNASIMIDFIDCTDEENALALMQSRELNAYVVIPDGFADALLSGENEKLRYVMARTGATMGAQLTREVIDVVSNYFIETQACCGALYNYARDAGIDREERVELDFDLSMRYTAAALDREKFTEVTEIGIGNNLSAVGYYVCGLTVFFVMAIGIAFCAVRVKSEHSLERLLYSRGYGACAQVLGEYLPYFAFVAVTVALPFIAAGVLSENFELPIGELEDLDLSDFISIFVGFLPAVFVITAMQFLLYELISGMINSVLVQFIVAVVMGYIGGCFYPLHFMPDAVQTAASMLPVGAAFNRFASLLTGASNTASLAVCAVYGAALMVLAAVARKLRIRLSEGA